MSTVSIIIPTYNRAYLLWTALDSVLQQSYSDFELIVIVDKSEDETASLINEYQQEDARVFYIRHELRKGGAAARNTGLARAQGKYIAFQDSDVKWYPTKLERQVALMEK